MRIVKMDGQEEEPDVKKFDATPANSSFATNSSGQNEQIEQTNPLVPFNQLDMYYNMAGKKYLCVFNHLDYENNSYYGPNAERLTRIGTNEDAMSLEDTFKDLGFKTSVYHNLFYQDILFEVRKLCEMDHSATSCVAVAVMTHGQNGGILLAHDKPYYLRELTDMLENEPKLLGKPKLCFVQACRSGHLNIGRLDLPDIVQPKHPDMLVLYSSSQHHYSYRTPEGTWLMQSLCDVIKEHHQFFSLLQMLTFVNQAVAYKSTKTTQKKQMPEVKHTLTKLLKF